MNAFGGRGTLETFDILTVSCLGTNAFGAQLFGNIGMKVVVRGFTIFAIVFFFGNFGSEVCCPGCKKIQYLIIL